MRLGVTKQSRAASGSNAFRFTPAVYSVVTVCLRKIFKNTLIHLRLEVGLTNAMEFAEDVRKRGNELYKAGKLLDAVDCYKRAAELAPSDAVPLSNLSAAYFELGQYTACRHTCQTALELLSNGDDLSSQKLHMRSLKASLLLKDIDHARDSLANLNPNHERQKLEKCLSLIEDNRHGGLDVEIKIISDLPLTKPQL
jgi:tetratricopeptide (TPR) repeat protein